MIGLNSSSRVMASLALACFLSASVQASTPIASVAAVRDLSLEEAEKALPVRVEGQVLWEHATGTGFFLHSGGVGVFVYRPPEVRGLVELSVGDVVRIEGVSDKGFFSPSIKAEKMEILGTKPLPEPRAYFNYEQFSTTIDCDWVWLAGRIVSMRAFPGGTSGDSIVLEVVQNNARVDVSIPLTEGAEEKISELMFKRVRFNAVAGTQFNMNRQVVGRIFFANSVDDFEVIDDYRPRGGVQSLPVQELMRKGQKPRLPMKTHGLVTHVEGRHVVLRGEKACIKATLRSAPDVVVGDYVELGGYISPGPISPEFLARDVRVLERRARPEPIKLELNAKLRELWDFHPEASLNQELVHIDAELVDVSETFGLSSGDPERTLLCRHEAYLFEAKLPAYMPISDELKPGAMLRLSGICNLTRSEERSWRLYIDWFWIQLRDASDIEILVPAPWWTAARLFGLLSIGLGLLALFLIWVLALRKTVGRQTATIGKQIKRESVLNERQRIARELHDTLEQGLTALSIQLKTIQRKITKNPTSAESAVELASSMLQVCRDESRASIHDLRGGILEEMDLPAAIEHTLIPLFENSRASLKIERTGGPVRLTLFAEHHVLRMSTEAANNSLRHAGPTQFRVLLEYGQDQLQLTLEDDGCGFDLEAVKNKGRFGIRGMYERANRLSGILEIDSEVGRGTKIILSMPIAEFLEETDHE